MGSCRSMFQVFQSHPWPQVYKTKHLRMQATFVKEWVTSSFVPRWDATCADHFYKHFEEEWFTEKGYYLNVRLMVSTCTKDEKKGYGYREECVTKKSQKPVILCAVCNKHDGGELTECAKLKELKKRREIQNKCSVFYFPGSEHPLFLKTGDNERDFECLGCV
ncbi:uncharacterized protein [Hoplias malabaricus]|uniref:uncharacterized protein isoform X2 n=1 Tax=Hoplias malabaricus TaxID=27720 RepID=UPI0034622E02